jgi:hypothetical protein
MAEPHILSTLRRKRDEIESVIAAYEAKIEAARLFGLTGDTQQYPVYMALNRL